MNPPSRRPSPPARPARGGALLALAVTTLAACRSAPSGRAPTPRTVAASEATPVAPHERSPGGLTLRPGAPLAWGCFAWSESRHAAACVTGYFGSNTPDTTDTREPRRYVVRFVGDPDAPTLPLLEPTADPNDPRDPATAPVSARALGAVQAALDAGGYAPIGGWGVRMGRGFARAWAEGAAVRRVTNATVTPLQQGAERFNERFEVRWASGAAYEPMGPDSLDQPTGDSEFRLYVLPGGRYVVLEQRWRYADEGEYGASTAAILCDRTARRCE